MPISHDHAGGEPPAVGRQEPPSARRLVPGQVGDPAIGGDLAVDAPLGGDPPQVGEDLGLPGVGSCPVRVLVKGIRVQVGRHVAAAAGVGVVPPGAAEIGRLLQNHEVVAASLGAFDRHADPAEAGAEDGDAEVGAVVERRWCRSGGRHGVSLTPRDRFGQGRSAAASSAAQAAAPPEFLEKTPPLQDPN
jgi:hypothetical protein